MENRRILSSNGFNPNPSDNSDEINPFEITQSSLGENSLDPNNPLANGMTQSAGPHGSIPPPLSFSENSLNSSDWAVDINVSIENMANSNNQRTNLDCSLTTSNDLQHSHLGDSRRSRLPSNIRFSDNQSTSGYISSSRRFHQDSATEFSDNFPMGLRHGESENSRRLRENADAEALLNLFPDLLGPPPNQATSPLNNPVNSNGSRLIQDYSMVNNSVNTIGSGILHEAPSQNNLVNPFGSRITHGSTMGPQHLENLDGQPVREENSSSSLRCQMCDAVFKSEDFNEFADNLCNKCRDKVFDELEEMHRRRSQSKR